MFVMPSPSSRSRSMDTRRACQPSAPLRISAQLHSISSSISTLHHIRTHHNLLSPPLKILPLQHHPNRNHGLQAQAIRRRLATLRLQLWRSVDARGPIAHAVSCGTRWSHGYGRRCRIAKQWLGLCERQSRQEQRLGQPDPQAVSRQPPRRASYTRYV